MNKEGLLVVVSGPSGVGKGTICSELLYKYPDYLEYSISLTTRAPRVGEQEGVNYYYTSDDEFLQLIEQGDLLEWANVYGNYYGTPLHFVNNKLQTGKDVILEIDIQGALKVQEKKPEGVFIFLLPPSLEELEARIKKRGTENKEDLNKRLQAAKREIMTVYKYHYVVINTDVSETAETIKSIVTAEKYRTDRNGKQMLERVINE